MEISSADTFPHYIPVGPNTGDVFVVKDLKKKKERTHLTRLIFCDSMISFS